MNAQPGLRINLRVCSRPSCQPAGASPRASSDPMQTEVLLVDGSSAIFFIADLPVTGRTGPRRGNPGGAEAIAVRKIRQMSTQTDRDPVDERDRSWAVELGKTQT